MNHLTERAILELRDGSLTDADSRLHVETCGECRRSLEDAEKRAREIEQALDTLDRPFDLAAAKARVRTRLQRDQAPAPQPVTRTHAPRPLQWAAGLVLLAAGAASAMPGSPVRRWLQPGPTASDVATPAPAAAAPIARAGVRVNASGGRIDVILESVPAGVRVEVVPSSVAEVSVSAAPGTDFTSSVGSVRARVAGGPVIVEASAHQLGRLMVNGVLIIEGGPGALRAHTPMLESGPDRLVFITPTR